MGYNATEMKETYSPVLYDVMNVTVCLSMKAITTEYVDTVNSIIFVYTCLIPSQNDCIRDNILIEHTGCVSLFSQC